MQNPEKCLNSGFQDFFFSSQYWVSKNHLKLVLHNDIKIKITLFLHYFSLLSLQMFLFKVKSVMYSFIFPAKNVIYFMFFVAFYVNAWYTNIRIRNWRMLYVSLCNRNS